MVRNYRKGKRAARGKGRRPARRAARKARNQPEKASMSVTRSYNLLTTNQTYRVYDVQLNQYARAVNTARSYQMYRITNCKLVVSPLFDTFAAGGGTTAPNIYFQVDRTRAITNIRTPQEYKALGCKPHRLDDKPITFQWKPSVLNSTIDSGPDQAVASVFNQYKISPWIRTRDETGGLGVWNPDTTDHMGLVFLAENSGGADIQYKAELTVEFEFCKPAIPMTLTETEPAPVELESLALEIPTG